MAEQALVELVNVEEAVLWREAEAKIADSRWNSVPRAINPHHLTTARQKLIAAGRLRLSDPFDSSGTRLLLPGDDRGRKDAIRTAERRKRRLHGRLERWSRATSKYPAGIIGEAGERVTRRSLEAAAVRGIRPVDPAAKDISSILGQAVAGGSLDSAAWAEQLDQHGRATGESVLCPIEVKNIRHWIYPDSHELFQLLQKAALLQETHEDVPICPLLVTRRESWTAEQMSRDLGFRILDVHKQFILPIAAVEETELAEVQNELGFTDLTRGDTADLTLTKILGSSARSSAPGNAERWRESGSDLVEHFETLRDASLSDAERREAMQELREEAEANGSWSGKW